MMTTVWKTDNQGNITAKENEEGNLGGELHNSTDNVPIASLKSLDGLVPRHSCLCHDQINIPGLHASFINLLLLFFICWWSSSCRRVFRFGRHRANVWHPELLGSLCLQLRAQILYLCLPKYDICLRMWALENIRL